MGIYNTPDCPECSTKLAVANFITAALAECAKCGTVVHINRDGSARSTAHSPAPQRDTQKF